MNRTLDTDNVEQLPTRLRGKAPDASKFNLADFRIEQDAAGRPQAQSVPVQAGYSSGSVARFDPQLCANCC
ncbi:MAG TPA: hypothetical protein VMT46_00020 [Anaerolineaceae bacterium]|nr:hypothetical protein [Anaerolineaceae bacterium]